MSKIDDIAARVAADRKAQAALPRRLHGLILRLEALTLEPSPRSVMRVRTELAQLGNAETLTAIERALVAAADRLARAVDEQLAARIEALECLTAARLAPVKPLSWQDRADLQ